MNNVLVRKAICLAIDRQSIIDNVVQVDAQPAYSFLAPGYSVDGKDITEGRESFGLSATADVEGAQAALAEAGYPNGEGFPTLTLSYYDNDTVKKVVEAMAEMLKNNLNINVEVSSNEWSIFYDDVQKGNYQVAAMGWSADYVNPMSFLPLCKTGDSSNNLFYSNADYDALVDQVKAENDPAKAAELTLQADAIVSNDDCFRQPVLQGCEGRLMRCTIETRDFGTMVFTLYPEYAPLTVANFVKTARSGFYDGLCWCRIVKDYVIQGGSPDNDIMTDSDWHIKGEFTENGVNNPLKHIRGALSMARDDDFDTAGTQFFVVHKDAAKLDGRYAAFGEMESGFDVLDAIANQPTYGPETWNKPKQMPVITKITIED